MPINIVDHRGHRIGIYLDYAGGYYACIDDDFSVGIKNEDTQQSAIAAAMQYINIVILRGR